MKKLVYVLLLTTLLMAGCGKKDAAKQNEQAVAMPQVATEVVAIGRVEPESKITAIGCEVGGVVAHLYIKEGDTVTKGELLVELAHDYEDAQLQQAKTKLATQQAEIENAKAQLASVQLKSKNLLVKLDRIKKMVEQSAETQQSLDNAQTEYDQSATDIERFTAALHAEEAKLHEKTADLSVLEAQIKQKKISAPCDGVVLHMNITEGASVNASGSLFDFAPASPLTVLCEVDELLADKVKTGQQAFIRNQGATDKLATGEVMYVGPYLKRKSLFSDDSGNMEDRRVREVRILLKDAAGLLYDARVEAVIDIR